MGDVPGAAQQGRAGGGVRVLRVRDSGARGCSSPPRCVSSAPSPAWGAFGLRVGHGQSQFCRVGPVHRQEEVELGAGDRGCCPVRSRAACSVASGRRALGPGRPPCRGLLSPRLCSVPGREWGGRAFPLTLETRSSPHWVTQPHLSLWPPSPAGRWQGSRFGLTGLGFQPGRATSLCLVGSHCQRLPPFQQRDSAASRVGRVGRGGDAHVPEIRADGSLPFAEALVSRPHRSGTPPGTDSPAPRGRDQDGGGRAGVAAAAPGGSF